MRKAKTLPEGRFLFVQSTTERGGAETALLNALAVSPALRARAAVVTLGFGRGSLPSDLRKLGAQVFEMPGGRLSHPLAASRTINQISRLARRIDARVILGNGSHPQVYGGVAARLCRARSFHFVHMIHSRPLLRNHPIDALAIVGPCDRALTCSEAAREAMESLRPGLPAEVVHPGTPVARVPPAQAASARRDLGAADGDMVFGIFGRLQRWKGQDVFVEAACRLASEQPRARFVVVGGAVFGLEPDWEVDLKQRVARAGLPGRVLFTGHRSDVASLMAACDVVCHATRLPEPFGMVLIEAMAQARPIIATRGGGPNEIVVDGVTGLLVPPDDVAAMVGAMRKLASDASFRLEAGQAGLRRVEEKFTAEAFARKVLSQLEAVIAR